MRWHANLTTLREVSRPTKSNVPAAALKWNVERTGIKFGMTSNTLRKALNKNSAIPDADGCFSTKQITDAVFGGLSEEKLLTQRELTRKYSLENQIVEASVLNRAELMKGFAGIADAMVSRIMASELSCTAKEDLLKELAGIPIVLENVAARQSKLRRSKNGQMLEEEQIIGSG